VELSDFRNGWIFGELQHKDIRMTLRYLQITQQDLQREFHVARKERRPSQLALMSLVSAKHSQQHAISWKCTAVSLPMRRLAASCSAWTSDFSPSPLNSIASPPPRNEETLAG
jgi:hypothetical protein